MNEDTEVIPKQPIPRLGDKPRNYIVMGVAGCGKTTIGMMLAGKIGYIYAEGDEFHTKANRDKMGSGHPLTDEDRWPWLDSIMRWMTAENNVGHSTVVSCSALRKVYRDVLRQATGDTYFVHISPPRELNEARLAARAGHFMKADMLISQYNTLEALEDDEAGVVITNPGEPIDVFQDVLKAINEENTPTSDLLD